MKMRRLLVKRLICAILVCFISACSLDSIKTVALSSSDVLEPYKAELASINLEYGTDYMIPTEYMTEAEINKAASFFSGMTITEFREYIYMTEYEIDITYTAGAGDTYELNVVKKRKDDSENMPCSFFETDEVDLKPLPFIMEERSGECEIICSPAPAPTKAGEKRSVYVHPLTLAEE